MTRLVRTVLSLVHAVLSTCADAAEADVQKVPIWVGLWSVFLVFAVRAHPNRGRSGNVGCRIRTSGPGVHLRAT